MEKIKTRQKKKKERVRTYNLERQIPDAPTLEEFECLLGESPTNYPRVEGVEDIESQLHSAAIDMNHDGYDDNDSCTAISNDTTTDESQASSGVLDRAEKIAITGQPTAPIMEIALEDAVVASATDNRDIDRIVSSVSSIRLEPMTEIVSPSAPFLHTLAGVNSSSLSSLSPLSVAEQSHEQTNTGKAMTPYETTSSTKPETDNTLDKRWKNLVPFTDNQLATLYHNDELSLVDSFVTDFMENVLRNNAARQHHRLHELLMSYLRVRNTLIVNCHELEDLKKNCKDVQKQLWCLDKAVISESGECQDGNPVKASHEYSIARFNQQALVGLTKNLSSIKDLLHNTQALYSYEAELLKLQIEHYINRVCTSCKEFVALAQNAPVNLAYVHTTTESVNTSEFEQLRTCITILFNFQRRIIRDGKFVLDSREWLSRLVAVLLRVANWQDHMFILNHILRCPGGVTNWAIGFVQTPLPVRNHSLTALTLSPFNDPYLDHMIASLAVILLPIRERDKFLQQVKISLQDTVGGNPSDTVWVMLDEEGEEDEDIADTGANLTESDLMALLHQIPLDKLFEHVCSRERETTKATDFTDKFDAVHHQRREQISSAPSSQPHRILRLFAFSTVLVRLLKQGLKTYDSPRYRQLAKRLSALIRDIVQYASDEWETCVNGNEIIGAAMYSRLEIEYDSFFIRAIICIFSSRRLGAWQYLAAIPYHLVSSCTLWQILCTLHRDETSVDYIRLDVSPSDWEKELNDSRLCDTFEEKLSDMPGDESYFLLTTFANMAMARSNSTDYEFIRATTIHLFQIGFLSKKTQISCSKDARSLLSNLISKHPSLLSDIIVKLRDNFESIGKLSLYLFMELRMDNWIPQEDDILVLSNWLHQNPLSSTENHLARLILSRLNWSTHRDRQTGTIELYLPAYLHHRIAILIVELAMKYLPVENSKASLISESVRQVSSIVRPQNNEQAFSLWAWEMMLKLRLHRLDQSQAACRKAITSPGEAFLNVPDLDSDASLEIIARGVRDVHPIACYVAVTMTLYGHSIPLICNEGFRHLLALKCFQKYEHLLMALHHIVPLFLDCSDSLLKNKLFLKLIVSIVSHDRSYMKMAKNFIAPDFPGPVLKNFSNMLESHMFDYKRYGLSSPMVLARLWLDILILVPEWNRDENVLFLIDTVVRGSFFHVDARTTIEDMFQNLFTNLGTTRGTGSLGSFISWATGAANTPSLLGGPVQSIWVAYHVLRTEHCERELKCGLWRQLLLELSVQTKTSLDAALKRACTSLKLPVFGPNELAIYKWSQQALDAPMDHPLLALLWQNFFTLFLARCPTIPGNAAPGGLGDKFFDGMLNLSYLKRVKKRLYDTVAYFQNKAEKDTATDDKPITDERRVFYLEAAKLYKTLSLWLEEPRLQETGLYLSALPPQYMSQKLSMLMQGDEEPWFEYVDYWSVQQCRLKSVQDWQHLCHRDVSTSDDEMEENENPPKKQLGINNRRFGNYERPKGPPALVRNSCLLDNVPRESLYEPEKVLETIKPHLKIIMDYAQTYNILVSEHTAVDCNFLELVPTLYREVENRVTLHALCDPAPTGSSGARRSRSGTPPTVHCAGPAVIRIKISEARVSEGVDHMIAQNRGVYENLLVKASQPPPTRVTQGCAFADHLVALLEYELNLNRTCESGIVLQKVQESGVKLFHHLVEFYTEEASLCPPTKQLVTTCIEKLGQAFISGEEIQGPSLLKSIIQRPNLGGLLGPHFTPVAGGAATFLQMYQTVVDLCTGPNDDLCFVLLSKFDVASWLNYRRPRLSERSTFIDLVSRALCNVGLNPEDSKLILHELFRNHLRLVLLHEFPEHYGEVLGAILRGSEGQSLSLDVWRDLLGALSGRSKTAAPIQSTKLREEIRRYATEQRLLSRQEMYDTAILLSKHFMKERLQYGLYGLYPKYRIYNEPLVTFLGMVGHALVVSTVQCDRGSLADQLCEQIWPVLSEMFAPWMTPYWTRNLREPTAAWIQQLTDDRSVLLPWIITDGPCANRTVGMFVECIRFVIDTLPASSKILCFLWQFYVTNFAHVSVKDHILNVIHGNFMSLPWDKFTPGISDVELMVKVVDQYLPDSHLFLGSVFVSIDWTAWINQSMLSQPLSVAARMHVCLLNLMVKLSNEPNVRQNERAVQAIIEAEKFAWHLVDATAYDQVINWHVMSCDPRVVLSSCSEQPHPIDIAVNDLLKVVAAYEPTVTHFHPTTLKKRQMYVRSWVKLLVNCTTRHKALLSTNMTAFTSALSRMLDDMETILTSTVSEGQQAPEAGLLISELLHSVNQSGLLVEQLRTSWASWLSEKTASSSPVLLGILRVVGIAAISPATLGQLLEAALEAYFKHSVTDQYEPTWTVVLGIIQPIVPRQPPVEGVLVADGRILALYALLLKRLPSCRDIREEGMLLVNLVEWIAAIKPMNTIEEKLPLLWAKTLELIYRQCQYSDNTVVAARSLKKFARALLAIADDAGQGWGILGAIGLRKASPLTIKCRFMCRALGVYSLAQLPESKSEQQFVRFTPHSPGVAPTRSNDSDIMEIRPSLEAIKAMQSLEALVGNKQYAQVKTDVEQAIKMIKDSANSLHNGTTITGLLATELYTQRYLHILID